MAAPTKMDTSAEQTSDSDSDTIEYNEGCLLDTWKAFVHDLDDGEFRPAFDYSNCSEEVSLYELECWKSRIEETVGVQFELSIDTRRHTITLVPTEPMTPVTLSLTVVDGLAATDARERGTCNPKDLEKTKISSNS